MSNREAAAASERPLPPLSQPRFYSGKGERFGAQVTGYYTAEQMHAYVIADRAASAPQAVAAQPAASGVDALMVDRPLWERDRIESDRRRDAEQSRASLTGAQPAPAAPNGAMTDENAGQMIADMLMECAKRLGNFPQADVDRRAWRHLLVYAPAAQPADSAMEGGSDVDA